MNPAAPATSPNGPFELPALPWAHDALEPVISMRTIDLHHGKHHRTYIEKLNALVTGGEFERLTLEDVVKRTANQSNLNQIFNNAAQAWNHGFYWQSLTPAGTEPGAEIRARLERDFGGFDQFVAAFTRQATECFGSGWAWLVANRGKLEIVTTSNAHTPMTQGMKPLLTVDVWEHAYYLDYQNKREAHVKAVVEKLLNWEFAAKNLARA